MCEDVAMSRICFLIALLVAFAAKHTNAQPVVYDTVARSVIGTELRWEIPIFGDHIAVSADGSRLLMFRQADSSYYIVNLATGAYKKLLSPPRYQYPESLFSIDPGVTVLCVNIEKELFRFYDLDADTLMFSERFDSYPQFSVKQDRLILGYGSFGVRRGLYTLSTREKISDLPNRYRHTVWFDDAHNKLYHPVEGGLYEIDPTDGRILQYWDISATYAVRRPHNSDWLYAYRGERAIWYNSAPTDFRVTVEAVNVITQERLTFVNYAGVNTTTAIDDTHILGATNSVAYLIRRTAVRNPTYKMIGEQPVFVFDAEARRSQLIVNPAFQVNGRSRVYDAIISQDLEWCIHNYIYTEPTRRIVLRCIRLDPAVTSVAQDGEQATGEREWLNHAAPWLEIRIQPEERVESVDIFTIDGGLAQHVEAGRITESPLRIDTRALAPGLYVCALTSGTEGEARTKRRSATFIVSH